LISGHDLRMTSRLIRKKKGTGKKWSDFGPSEYRLFGIMNYDLGFGVESV